MGMNNKMAGLNPAGSVPKRSGNPGKGGDLNDAFGGQGPNDMPAGIPYTPTPRGGMPATVNTPSSGAAPFTTGEKSASGVPSTPKE